jgi:hypothetical protein
MTKKEIIKEISIQMYSDTCSECINHDKCHANGIIDYDAVEKCVEELENELRRDACHAL